MSDQIVRAGVIILAVGFVPALVVTWVFEWTPDGLRRDAEVDHSAPSRVSAARRFDRVIIATLSLAVVLFAVDKFLFDPVRDQQIAQQAAEQARDAALIESYGEHSIAVLPFVDLSPGGDQEYFSDGIAEEIISLLSRIRELRVIARSSAFAFKGQNLAASIVAERLNVRYVMEGSVRRAGDGVRITTTVIDGSTDTQLWSESFDRKFDDVFAIQDEIAGEVVDRLQLQISGNLPAVARVDPESYSLYLQARYLLGKQNSDAVREAHRTLETALEIDPANVAGWLLVDRVERSRSYWGMISREDYVARSRFAVEKVLQLDPGNPEGLVLNRLLAAPALDTWEGELDGVTYGLQVSPTEVVANGRAADVLSHLGYFDLSLEYSSYVLAKDPLCAGCLRTMMMTLISRGEYDQAADIANKYRAITGGAGTYTLGFIQLLQGDPETALATVESAGTIPFVIQQGRAISFWELGRLDDYEQALAELENALENDAFADARVRPEGYLAGVYAWVGRKDDAFALLDQLIDPPRSWGPVRWNVDPVFRNLHDDARWIGLLEKEEIRRGTSRATRWNNDFPAQAECRHTRFRRSRFARIQPDS